MTTAAQLRTRLHPDDGFTLVELLIALAVVAVLLAIAIPSYLGFSGRAKDTSVAADLRSALPGVSAFYAANSSYVGMTADVLRQSYDAGLSDWITVSNQSARGFTLTYAKGQCRAVFDGPGDLSAVRPTDCS